MSAVKESPSQVGDRRSQVPAIGGWAKTLRSVESKAKNFEALRDPVKARVVTFVPARPSAL